MGDLSRTQFLRRGALAAGGAAAFGLLEPLAALGRAAGSPSPIPGGFSFTEGPVPKDPDIHVLFPGIAPDAPVLDVATITNFKGAVAAAEIDGGAHGSDGTSYQFDADMRVMQGTYIDTSGSLKKGTFGFIWIDLFTGAVGVSPQVHDFEPGIASNGLFWTIPIAPGWVDIDPDSGSARFVGRNVPVPDFHDFGNAVGGGPSVPSRVDFEVTWTRAGDPVAAGSPSDAFDFAATLTPATAAITFTAKNDHSDVVYTSDPDLSSQVNPVTPVVGTEQNGVFHS